MTDLNADFYSGKCLLIAEDDSELRELLVAEFEMLGAEVLQAADGNAAFDLLTQHPVDLLLSDVRMPGGDGVELLKRLRERNYAVPVLMFITGYAELSLAQAFDLGADGLITKPFDLDELDDCIQRCMTPKVKRWATPPAPGVSGHFHRKYRSIEAAQTSGALKLGRGGFFISESCDPLAVGRHINIHIEFEEGPVHDLDGTGVVRWSRNAPRVDPAPSGGCGIELETLIQESALQVQAYIEKTQPRAYIPLN